jgi:Flp pilus assembly protein TadG
MLIKRILKNNKGQSLVELAILLPVLLLILMGIFEFGRVMNNYLIITQLAREGARAASVGKEDTEIIQVINSFSNTLDTSKLTVNISPEISSRKRGTDVTVTVGYDVDIIVPIIETLVPDPLHIEAQTIMRVE